MATLDKNDRRPRPLAHKSVASLFKGQQMPVVKAFKPKKVQRIKTRALLFYSIYFGTRVNSLKKPELLYTEDALYLVQITTHLKLVE